MKFEFTKEQRQIRNAVRDFSVKELRPNYTDYDCEDKFSRDIWKKIGDLGLIGACIPQENGGLGIDCVSQGVAAEEIAKEDPNMCSATFAVAEICLSLLANGTDIVKKKFLEPVVSGDIVPAFALTEPHCGTDASAIITSAIRKKDKYILNGEKSGITLIGDADVAVVIAKTNDISKKSSVCAFAVPMNLPGIKRQNFRDLGGRSLSRGSVFLDNVEIPKAYLLGKEGDGFKMVMRIFDASRVHLSLLCIGAAITTIKETIAYVKERQAFGKSLAKFEGVSFPIVEHYSIIEAIRLMCFKALWLRDEGKPHTKEAAMVKSMAPKYCVQAIHDCLLLHGHYGYTQDLPIEKRLRDVMGFEIADGTNQVSNIVVARELFGRNYLPY